MKSHAQGTVVAHIELLNTAATLEWMADVQEVERAHVAAQLAHIHSAMDLAAAQLARVEAAQAQAAIDREAERAHAAAQLARVEAAQAQATAKLVEALAELARVDTEQEAERVALTARVYSLEVLTCELKRDRAATWLRAASDSVEEMSCCSVLGVPQEYVQRLKIRGIASLGEKLKSCTQVIEATMTAFHDVHGEDSVLSPM
ncbi:hypothetical protein EON66_09180, partial [archaeon]